MSRKLDALFAVEVLGEPSTYFSASPGPTTSLDAAWPGVEKVGGDASLNTCWCGDFPDRHFEAELTPYAAYMAEAPTPALALVKACLLAVGVTQVEIDDASKQD